MVFASIYSDIYASNIEYIDKPIINKDYIFATWMATTQDLKILPKF